MWSGFHCCRVAGASSSALCLPKVEFGFPFFSGVEFSQIGSGQPALVQWENGSSARLNAPFGVPSFDVAGCCGEPGTFRVFVPFAIVARLPSPSVVFAVLVPWLRASIDASRHFVPSRTWCLSTDVSGLTPPRTPLMFCSCRDVRRSRCVSLVSPSKGPRLVADAWVRMRGVALAHSRACKKPPIGLVSVDQSRGTNISR